VVFGATGDLTRRKLMPAVYNLAACGFLPARFALVGCARRGWSADEFRAQMRAGVNEFSRTGLVDPVWGALAPALEFVSGDFADPATYARLRERLASVDAAHGTGGSRLFYLAVPPDEFRAILTGLQAAGLVAEPGAPAFSRVILEKPFGSSLETARELNALVGSVLDESQTFRIDHYLGKETVQNIMVFRFANSMFEPLWNRKYVDHVQITAAETVGVGTRGRFYDTTGVLRDIVQNHLLEVLTLCAMEPPNSGHADDVRGEKLKVLRALRQPWSDTVPLDVVLGQYDGYRAEPDVAPDSRTPTFAAMRVFVDNWRWQGVPFYLRSGKCLARRVSEIAVCFKRAPGSLFAGSERFLIAANTLSFQIQPDEGLSLILNAKIPGLETRTQPVKMNFRYATTFGSNTPEAYERLVLDAMIGDGTLFIRGDETERSWQLCTPILDHWREQGRQGLDTYAAGSWGPKDSDALLDANGHSWREP
jgi:glucose-6-phosphate 1-dehydrogenase